MVKEGTAFSVLPKKTNLGTNGRSLVGKISIQFKERSVNSQSLMLWGTSS